MDAHLVCSKLYINPFRFQVANPNQRFTINVTFATLHDLKSIWCVLCSRFKNTRHDDNKKRGLEHVSHVFSSIFTNFSSLRKVGHFMQAMFETSPVICEIKPQCYSKLNFICFLWNRWLWTP